MENNRIKFLIDSIRDGFIIKVFVQPNEKQANYQALILDDDDIMYLENKYKYKLEEEMNLKINYI